jgi:hypothetical protein
MAFQVVELYLDAEDNVIDRRAVPYPYPTRGEAVDTIETIISRFQESGYEQEGQFWWAVTRDGKNRIRFIIEDI